jgi:acyl carrier protein
MRTFSKACSSRPGLCAARAGGQAAAYNLTLCPARRGAALRWAFQDLRELPNVSTSSPTPDLAALERELAVLFVDSLNLETPAEQIDPTQSLFGDGLGLDSIDILEVALEVSQRYGFQLRSDDENNQKIFQNLRSLAAHVAQHRTK